MKVVTSSVRLTYKYLSKDRALVRVAEQFILVPI